MKMLRTAQESGKTLKPTMALAKNKLLLMFSIVNFVCLNETFIFAL